MSQELPDWSAPGFVPDWCKPKSTPKEIVDATWPTNVDFSARKFEAPPFDRDAALRALLALDKTGLGERAKAFGWKPSSVAINKALEALAGDRIANAMLDLGLEKQIEAQVEQGKYWFEKTKRKELKTGQTVHDASDVPRRMAKNRMDYDLILLGLADPSITCDAIAAIQLVIEVVNAERAKKRVEMGPKVRASKRSKSKSKSKSDEPMLFGGL